MDFSRNLGLRIVRRIFHSVRYRALRFANRKKRRQLEEGAETIGNFVREQKYTEAVRRYRQMIVEETSADDIYYTVAGRWTHDDTVAGAFYQACIDSLKLADLRHLINFVARSPLLYRPSKFWLFYATYHALQLDIWGVDQFKRTVNNGYFNWTGDATIIEHCQRIQQILGLDGSAVRSLQPSWEPSDKPEKFSGKKWSSYARFLCLLFEYAQKNDTHRLFQTVQESRLGNPVGVTYQDRYITQDLCNSVLDVNLMLDTTGLDPQQPLRIMELGAGHGRIMYTFLKAFPRSQIVIVDIPPALFVSQWYLTNAFPELKAFKFREIASYDEIKDEFESASLAFLAPEQLELIPGKSIDLFVNISSLHEMTPPQIQNWFQQIDRVCRGWFYTKQFKEYPNLIDDIVVRESDYPVLPGWQEKMKRTNPIFSSFFEAVYKM